MRALKKRLKRILIKEVGWKSLRADTSKSLALMINTLKLLYFFEAIVSNLTS